jgi:hypothetical protein
VIKNIKSNSIKIKSLSGSCNIEVEDKTKYKIRGLDISFGSNDSYSDFWIFLFFVLIGGKFIIGS